MKIRTRALLGIGLLLSSPAIAANREDAALNRVYETIAAGVAANDGAAITAAFADDAVVLDPRPTPPAEGAVFRETIGRMAARLAADHAKVRADYRLQRRTVTGNVAIDVGYRRQSIEGNAGGPVPGVQYSKFLVVLTRQGGGAWKILRDASLPATQTAWDAAQPVDGLKFDR